MAVNRLAKSAQFWADFLFLAGAAIIFFDENNIIRSNIVLFTPIKNSQYHCYVNT